MTSPARTDKTLPDGRQRSPGTADLLRAGRGLVGRVPGMVTAARRYLAHRSAIEHTHHDHQGQPVDAPDGDRQLAGDSSTLLRRGHGAGPLYRRLYEVVIDDARTGPEELISRLLTDPNRASPTEVSDFQAVPGAGRAPGAEFAVHMPGPWDAPVRVIERTPTSFRFHTLRGHMEAGEIEFRAAWGDGGRLSFTIESWARSGDRLYDWLYTRVPVTREMQLHMWSHVCKQVAGLVGGAQQGPVRVTTHRWSDGG